MELGYIFRIFSIGLSKDSRCPFSITIYMVVDNCFVAYRLQ